MESCKEFTFTFSYGGQLWRLKARNYAMIFMGITYRIMIPELGEVLTMQKEGGSIHDRFAAAFFFLPVDVGCGVD